MTNQVPQPRTPYFAYGLRRFGTDTEVRCILHDVELHGVAGCGLAMYLSCQLITLLRCLRITLTVRV